MELHCWSESDHSAGVAKIARNFPNVTKLDFIAKMRLARLR